VNFPWQIELLTSGVTSSLEGESFLFDSAGEAMAGNMPRPPTSGAGRTAPESRVARSRESAFGGGDKASVIPVVLALLSVFAGLFLMGGVLGSTGMYALWLGLGGYLTAGFMPPLFLGLDAISQRRGMKNPNYRVRREFGQILRVIVFVGIAVAIVHLWVVADVLAVIVSELLFVWGVLTP